VFQVLKSLRPFNLNKNSVLLWETHKNRAKIQLVANLWFTYLNASEVE